MAVVWHRSEQAEPLARNALEGVIRERSNKPTLFLLSGGSWLSIYNRVSISNPAIYSTFTFSMADDRVTKDPAHSNAAQFAHTRLYLDMIAKGATHIDTTHMGDETPEMHAARLEHAIRAWRKANPDGFVCATVGIGRDGHIAGILPLATRVNTSLEMLSGERWFLGYESTIEGAQTYRSTITFRGMRELITHAIVYAEGREKHAALKDLYNQKGELDSLPSMILYELPHVDIYTDLS